MAVLQSSPEPVGEAAGSRSRTPGAWAAVLFVIAAALMAAYLYISHEVDSFQTQAIALLEERTNASISVGAANIAGLRSIGLQDVRISYRSENGLQFEGEAPSIVAAINPVAWFDDGQVVSEFTIRGGTIHIDATEYVSDDNKSDNAWLKRLPGSLTLEDFAVVIDGIRDYESVRFAAVSATLTKEQSGNAMSASFEGMYADDSDKSVSGRMRYKDVDDFDCEVRMNALTAGDINVFLPEEHHVAQAGRLTPSLTVDAFPDATFALSFEAGFEDVTVRDQPEFVGPLTGEISAFARYDRETQRLAIRTARVAADELRADLSGSLTFAGETHGIDLELQASQLPVQAALEYYLPESLDEYGRIDIAFEQPEQFELVVSGTTESYVVKATGRAPGATVSFRPKDEQFPTGSVQLGAIEAGWDSTTETPFVTAAIRDGVVTHADTGIEANRVSGAIRFENNVLIVDPLTAEVFGEPFVSRAEYSVDNETGTATLSGTLRRIEDTALADAIKDTLLAGAVDVNATAKFEGGIATANGSVEATNTAIDYNWWFSKAPGIGARADAEVTFKPDESITVLAKAEVASSLLDSRIDFVRRGDRWRLNSAKTTSESVDVVSAGKCIRLPYTITGGTVTGGYHEWKAGQTEGVQSEIVVGGIIDQISILPDTGVTPIAIENVTVTTALTKGEKNFGELTVKAENAAMPAFGEVWFRPLREDEALLKRFPPVDRDWTYHLSADQLSLPPWNGTNFTGTTTSGNGIVSLDPYSANVGEGKVKGAYTTYTEENRYETRLEWEKIDTKYFIEHLQMDDVLSGLIDGQVAYGMDRDDPGTLAGNGEFTINEGQFNANFVINLIERQMQGDTSTLPPSLKFDRLYSTVEFSGDTVKTPVVELDAEGLVVRGEGQYVNDGDMDYTLKLSISPDTARQIPALRENLNLQGYELAQRMIELPFHVTGPTGAPVSTVTDAPPMRVTLVTGALEVTREAFNVIDAPRKILVDLLKTAGGLVGARKSGADNGT